MLFIDKPAFVFSVPQKRTKETADGFACVQIFFGLSYFSGKCKTPVLSEVKG
ncbi:hypothetical protein ZMO1_ZMO2013 [Zymomonas mobilis subsp. mobilis ZM4 = ATCC 31821]|uniref:Uncharacterized protein n=1 Tax=Zymomonas mobilis subsp. mobilis (strain ATCC 31821 / ZM4 / CP4) TaxID=264203 RepID=D9PNM6_ZYMMO|nr:hypothetical protein Za10_0061 [Zymomonas mobilis subsp. mobilis NCIMB 11163]ADK75092.1 hypothetical protein ZMO2013 [Zymomonas mobilis subsp. mobilis ZM4 = ATCC 31821]AVZ26153.1 hypothetical protein ZMO2_ZMO2013 [Zymomonas mobilis subsp. mobilis]AVZ28040.1 hypothetical protein ZMO3_ZMO2013 [Zymomonas mobilis subsp. mobilis]AVZ42485.1 hypothetical protein ZMO1_ZMO2013 [Zymomonas mobilis subsp. mobilis ZM4 = ATCC 31821]